MVLYVYNIDNMYCHTHGYYACEHIHFLFSVPCYGCFRLLCLYDGKSVMAVQNRKNDKVYRDTDSEWKGDMLMKALSEAEWNIMESLWEYSPKVGSQIAADMVTRTGWSRSTTLTMLKRMSEKGLITCEDNGRMRTYIPVIEREDAVKKETESFLKRVYHGSISMLVSGFVERQRLSQEELAELREILDKAEEKRYE